MNWIIVNRLKRKPKQYSYQSNCNRYSVVLLLSGLLCALQISCGGESLEMARKKLEVILKDDLAAIIEDIPKESLRDNPHYDLWEYREFSKGNYAIKASADFFFFRSVNVKIVRKYRYVRKNRLWERYFNEYRSLPDSITPQSP